MFLKNKNQILLLITNVALVFFAIMLFNLNVLPLRLEDFIFFAILTLLLTLYRPGWGFLLFAGTSMLENINLAPVELGIAIRPYQFFGGLTILAIIIRLATKRLNFKLIRLAWYDWAMIVFGAASFVSAIFASNRGVGLKQSVVLTSFIFLYFLVRNYIQTSEDLKKVIPFFLSSSVVVVLYGIWQNIQFMRGASHFEVMPGRPNGTFAEADWLGIFLVLLLAIIYTILYQNTVIARRETTKQSHTDTQRPEESQKEIAALLSVARNDMIIFIFLTLIFIALILTVSRSAWLGAVGVTILLWFAVITRLKLNFREWQWREAFWMKIKVICAFMIAVVMVYFFHLTNFQLANRVQSTGGLQKITISCLEEKSFDAQPQELSDLETINCRHINLEEVETEKSAGHFVTEVFRRDPNVNVRSEIYKKSWNLIKQNPILGIGWGNVSSYLGTDERGTGLNASNIFLEIWLGSGIIGLLAFLAVWLWILGKSARDFFLAKDSQKFLPLFILLGWFALTIPNLFNSGIMLGFLWVFLGIAFISNEK
ncbi:MAG: O-antigen ligase family protein [Candidatus Moranbacteria bacterium]|nr:O-antigen ligase family protein [Candidatus Moranbacteria bacterium]